MQLFPRTSCDCVNKGRTSRDFLVTPHSSCLPTKWKFAKDLMSLDFWALTLDGCWSIFLVDTIVGMESNHSFISFWFETPSNWRCKMTIFMIFNGRNSSLCQEKKSRYLHSCLFAAIRSGPCWRFRDYTQSNILLISQSQQQLILGCDFFNTTTPVPTAFIFCRV